MCIGGGVEQRESPVAGDAVGLLAAADRHVEALGADRAADLRRVDGRRGRLPADCDPQLLRGRRAVEARADPDVGDALLEETVFARLRRDVAGLLGGVGEQRHVADADDACWAATARRSRCASRSPSLRSIAYEAVNVLPSTASRRASTRSTSAMPVGSCETRVDRRGAEASAWLSEGTHALRPHDRSEHDRREGERGQGAAAGHDGEG